ncbi:tectonic-2 isoform X2 [Dromiciops gliroides]|uniref:tectonic-2 isoform X2 n=1 Tax=Dromiciops gliroides TaxID=33562 RepID=UPI001CC7EFFC|nr:tectonic-2 isoform X2 [Dromiciops gliroides]
MGPARLRPPPAPQLLLLLLFPLGFPRALWGEVAFLPPFVQMSDTSVSVVLVGDTGDVDVTLAVLDDEQGILPVPDCGLQNNGTSNWSLTVTPDVRGSEVTVSLNGDVQSCAPETDFFSDFPCFVETLLVSASRNTSCLAHLLIQVEIYPNASFAQNIPDSNISLSNLVYQPFGSCPCNLAIGICDVRCCCDEECTPSFLDLFRDYCFPGVFGGNVNPPFDQLCSTPVTDRSPDWFPFLCIHSSMDNSPFLGYFYHGSTVFREESNFQGSIPSDVKDWSDFGYLQDSPLMTLEKTTFTIPQVSILGQCVRQAPVAFLQNFDVKCIINLATYHQEWEDISKMKIKNGSIGGFVVPQVTYEESTALNRFIYDTEEFLKPEPKFKFVNLEEHYIFRWKEKTITKLDVKILRAKIHPDQQGVLSQRFKVQFLDYDGPEIPKRSGNPGYLIGKPVRAINAENAENDKNFDGITTLNIWQPVGRGLCSEAETTPVLFRVNAASECLLEFSMQENCTQLREVVINHFKSLVQVTHVAKQGNSEYKDLHETWTKILWRDPPVPGDSLHLRDIKGICLDVPGVMTIRFIISEGGLLEGTLVEEIIASEVSFSSVTWQFQCGFTCEDKPHLFPISVSVQFIKVPYKPVKPLTSFQINHTSSDCTKNEVCWSELFYPLTENYQGESRFSCFGKTLMLAFFFTLIMFFSSPWIGVSRIWDLFSI